MERVSGRDEVELRRIAVTDTEYGTIVKYSGFPHDNYLDCRTTTLSSAITIDIDNTIDAEWKSYISTQQVRSDAVRKTHDSKYTNKKISTEIPTTVVSGKYLNTKKIQTTRLLTVKHVNKPLHLNHTIQ